MKKKKKVFKLFNTTNLIHNLKELRDEFIAFTGITPSVLLLGKYEYIEFTKLTNNSKIIKPKKDGSLTFMGIDVIEVVKDNYIRLA